MKIVNTYKQGSITWFEHKAVYSSTISLQLISVRNVGELPRWLDAKLITKRTKDTV